MEESKSISSSSSIGGQDSRDQRTKEVRDRGRGDYVPSKHSKGRRSVDGVASPSRPASSEGVGVRADESAGRKQANARRPVGVWCCKGE